MSNNYYIYGSNHQAYHALINNSIVAKSAMREDFKSDTLSYLSKDFLFVTKEKIPREHRYEGITDAYYSVALEIADPENLITAVLVVKEESGDIRLTDRCKLNEYDNEDGCIGAFVCGEIPISYLSGIYFESEEQKTSFNKSSLDLWFPKDLYQIMDYDNVNEKLSIDHFRNAANKIDSLLQEDDIVKIRKVVSNRNRMKAALYYAIEATNNWNIGAVRGNIDSTLMHFLDKEKRLEELVYKYFQYFEGAEDISFEKFIESTDDVLEGNKEDINSFFFSIIIKSLLKDTNVKSKLPKEFLNNIGQECIECSKCERTDVLSSMNVIVQYLTTNMDPDKAMGLLGKYDVLRAFMVFMDQSENADFLKRATLKLSQKERRYAYIMFGVLNGMFDVERSQKSNRELEICLEEKVMEIFPCDYLIDSVPKNSIFMNLIKKNDKEAFGIMPSFNLWYDCGTSQEILLKTEESSVLEKVYLAMAKTCKNDPIPEQDIYTFEEPVVVKLQVGENIIESFSILRKKDAKNFGKKIERTLKAQKEIFNVKGFKLYLAEEKRYQKFYKKNTDLVQELCRKVKVEKE